jgi:TonB family protein
MRTQLENIERAEQYLNNEMTASERQAFETELTTDATLRDTVAQVKALRSAVIRKELRSRIESHAGGGNNWGKGIGLGLLVLLLLGGMAWYFFSPTETAVVVVEETPLSASDSIEPAQWAEGTFELGGHKLWAKPDIQRFGFASSEGATIEGKDGILVIVPSNAFVDSSGKVVSGKVDFKLVEALGIEQMVLYRLKTMSNGSMLESGGMFYIEAQVDGTPVQINPSRPLYIEIPTLEKKPGMMAFTGEVASDGELNWVNPKPLKKYLVKLPLGDLDFLPAGFANEVEGNMPFLSYKKATDAVTDSLYYSLEYPNMAESDVVKDAPCGIDPSSIETIKQSKFANTFIATQEFEERIKVLHGTPEGQQLLELYIRNLTTDLRISDSLAARTATGEWKARFSAFASENLTNVKDAELYQQRLSDFYSKKREELTQHHRKLAEGLAAKNAAELNSMLAQLGESVNNSFPMMNRLPMPSAATSQVYATPWYSTGWGNIDRYFKLIDRGSFQVAITVSNMPSGAEVTQWLGEVNTYTDLRSQGESFMATFPKIPFGRNPKTHVFAIAEAEEGYEWGIRHYSPYTERNVELAMAPASREDVQRDLIGLDMSIGRLHLQMTWRRKQAERVLQSLAEARKRQEEWLRLRAELQAKYNVVQQRQMEIQRVMERLREFVFPCAESLETDDTSVADDVSASEVVLDEQVGEPDYFTIVEDMPKYPGGDAALIKYIAENVRYPQSAKENGVTGVVYVSYIVGADGRVSNVRVVRSSGPELDAEAVRVVSMLPRHTPGRQRGQAVPVQFTIPVRFVLN